jgi:hypothetical protein
MNARYIQIAIIFVLTALFTSGAGGLLTSKAYAHGKCPCAPCEMSCVRIHHEILRADIMAEHILTRSHITDEFKTHQLWLLNDFFIDKILPPMMMMAEQLTTVGMQQMMILGSFFDAKNQLETQQLLQSKTAQAHKDYQPSTGMCEIGTSVRTLYTAQKDTEFNHFVLTQRSQDRQLGIAYGSGSLDRDGDRDSRYQQFRRRYCNPKDNNGVLANLCLAAIDPQFMNRDIDYTRLIDYPRTLDLDYSDNVLSDDEQDLMAFGSNLFGHDLFDRKNMQSTGEIESRKDEYLDIRSTLAKRSVAENSFYAIASMKSKNISATSDVTPYLQALLSRLGVEDNGDLKNMLGDQPSYYAVMDVMGQKIYQDPAFFTNLYDKPTNVARKDVAMQAIGLMMDRNLYKSELRSEAVLSLLLEMELQGLHDETDRLIQTLQDNNAQALPTGEDEEEGQSQ